jgi:hypothetical protein
MTRIIPTVDLGTELTDARHHVHDDSLGAGLVTHLCSEAGRGGWWAVVMRSNGTLHFRKDFPHTALPEDEKRDYAKRLCIALNHELAHYNGVWVVAWVDDARKIVMLWKDVDGDHQVTLFDDETWLRMKKKPIEWHVGNGEVLIRKWVYEFQKRLGLTDRQQFLAAKGQRAPSSRQ